MLFLLMKAMLKKMNLRDEISIEMFKLNNEMKLEQK